VSKVGLLSLFYAPTSEPVGSNFSNLTGTNGFTRWTTNNELQMM